MELLHYLLKSGLVLGLFLTIYGLFLKKETHFQWHRIFLNTGIILSFGLPLLILTQVIYISIPVREQVIPLVNQALTTHTNTINWSFYIGILYFLGVVIMTLRFLHQCNSLYKIISKSSVSKLENQQYLDTSIKCTPFSFFNYIIINKKLHTAEEIRMILTHENVHSSQYHSLDILLSNLLLIIQWWNPMAWFYKKYMEENIEYIADTETIKEISCPKAYQYALVKNIVSNIQPALATHFYQSLIKKRIIMLNKPTSNNISRWKTILVLPLIALFFWTFNMEAQFKFEQIDKEATHYIVSPKTPKMEWNSMEKYANSNPFKLTDTQQNSKEEATLKTITNSNDSNTEKPALKTQGKELPVTPVFTKYSAVIQTQDSLIKIKIPKVLYVLNGKKVSSKIIEAIDPDKIKSINILKRSNATEKYGIKATNGAIEIYTKSTNIITATRKNTKPSFTLSNIETPKKGNSKTPLYILEGKEITAAQLKDIKPEQIKAINVLKNKQAIAKYGRKGTNGVLEITLKPSATNTPKNTRNITDEKETNTDELAKDSIKIIRIIKGNPTVKINDKRGEE